MRYRRFTAMLVVIATAVTPAFFLRCDRASLQLQRGFWYGLGFNTSGAITDVVARNIQLPGGE